jgi:hypothetical protein
MTRQQGRAQAVVIHPPIPACEKQHENIRQLRFALLALALPRAGFGRRVYRIFTAASSAILAPGAPFPSTVNAPRGAHLFTDVTHSPMKKEIRQSCFSLEKSACCA